MSRTAGMIILGILAILWASACGDSPQPAPTQVAKVVDSATTVSNDLGPIQTPPATHASTPDATTAPDPAPTATQTPTSESTVVPSPAATATQTPTQVPTSVPSLVSTATQAPTPAPTTPPTPTPLPTPSVPSTPTSTTPVPATTPVPTPSSPGADQTVDATFGRLDVTSRGEEGKPLNSDVYVYDQASGDYVSGDSTGSDGTVSFYLRQGVYSVYVSQHNTIAVEDINLVGGESSNVGVDFGRLVLIYAANVDAYLYDGPSGDYIEGQRTGRDGRAIWYLREGTYKVNTSEPVKEFEGISILAGQTTVIGETSNHPPEIDVASAYPELIKAGESTELTVRAFDKNDDPLTYTYKPSVGTIIGEGPRVTYTAPNAGGEYRIDIEVSDGQGGVAQTTLYVSGGVLKVTSLGGDDERPLNSDVYVYDQASGDYVSGDSTGSDGTVSFYLRQGVYSVYVSQHNTIAVEDLEVSTDQETAARVFFGRLDVTSRGEEGKPLNSDVYVYDQASGDYVSGDSTGSDGTVSFYLRQGVYSVYVSQHNTIAVEDINLVGGESSNVGVDFGRLVLIYAANVDAYLYDGPSGDYIEGQRTGRDGRAIWYLREGTYKVNTSEPVKEFEGISILAGQTTVIGETSNHPPEIDVASAYPELIKAGESTELTVRAFDKNDDPLTYTYKPSVGTIIGRGTQSYLHRARCRGRVSHQYRGQRWPRWCGTENFVCLWRCLESDILGGRR